MSSKLLWVKKCLQNEDILSNLASLDTISFEIRRIRERGAIQNANNLWKFDTSVPVRIDRPNLKKLHLFAVDRNKSPPPSAQHRSVKRWTFLAFLPLPDHMAIKPVRNISRFSNCPSWMVAVNGTPRPSRKVFNSGHKFLSPRVFFSVDSREGWWWSKGESRNKWPVNLFWFIKVVWWDISLRFSDWGFGRVQWTLMGYEMCAFLCILSISEMFRQ